MNRLKKLFNIKEETLDEKIERDLYNFYRWKWPYSIWWFCKKYNIENKQNYIGYQLRVMNRKLNIAKHMEEEERIENTSTILKNYKEIIKKQLPSE